jgi:hypothetical protein
VVEGVEWTVGVDAGVVRAHQHAAGARHQPPADVPAEVVAPVELDTGGGVESQEIGGEAEPGSVGRSRGGLTCKIHLAADRRCRPISRGLTGPAPSGMTSGNMEIAGHGGAVQVG